MFISYHLPQNRGLNLGFGTGLDLPSDLADLVIEYLMDTAHRRNAAVFMLYFATKMSDNSEMLHKFKILTLIITFREKKSKPEHPKGQFGPPVSDVTLF